MKNKVKKGSWIDTLKEKEIACHKINESRKSAKFSELKFEMKYFWEKPYKFSLCI